MSDVPRCIVCSSTLVQTLRSIPRKVFCRRTCTEDHEHEAIVFCTEHRCVACGAEWEDGSGDFVHLAPEPI